MRDGRQEMGDKRQETGDGRWDKGDMRCLSGVESWEFSARVL